MFPDSKIAANLKLSHTSASYMIADGMSKYFTQLIVKDLVKSKLPFCIHFDETTSTQVKKQMDLTCKVLVPNTWGSLDNILYISFLWSCRR